MLKIQKGEDNKSKLLLELIGKENLNRKINVMIEAMQKMRNEKDSNFPQITSI
jgi:hypothetical protein